MSRTFPIGLAPPDWLVRNLRPQRTPVNRPAVARAAIALTPPLALGLAAGRPEYGALASMGALSGVISDTAAARVRIKQGAEPPSTAEVGQVTLQLRELADGLRRTKTLYEVRSDLSGPPGSLSGPPGSVLEPLRQEVAAARTIASPR